MTELTIRTSVERTPRHRLENAEARPERELQGPRGLSLSGHPDATTGGSDRALFRDESHSPVTHSPARSCPL